MKKIIPIREFKPFVDLGLTFWSERKVVTKRELLFRQKAAKAIEILGYNPKTVLQYRSLSQARFIAKNCLYSFTLIKKIEISVYGKERNDLKKRIFAHKSDNRPIQSVLFED